MGGRTTRTAYDQWAAEALERFRQTGIRLDREGRFWHEGGEIVHAGLRRALLRWLDHLDDGRTILRLDDDRYVYLQVEDAPLLVVGVSRRASSHPRSWTPSEPGFWDYQDPQKIEREKKKGESGERP